MVRTEEQEKQTREARLLVSSPEVVYSELKIYRENAARDIVAADEKWKISCSRVKIL